MGHFQKSNTFVKSIIKKLYSCIYEYVPKINFHTEMVGEKGLNWKGTNVWSGNDLTKTKLSKPV